MIKLLFWSFKLAFHQQNFSTNPFKTLYICVCMCFFFLLSLVCSFNRLCAFCFSISLVQLVFPLLVSVDVLLLPSFSISLVRALASDCVCCYCWWYYFFFFFGFRPIFHMYKHFKFIVSCKKKCEYESRAKSCTYLCIIWCIQLNF